MKKIVKWVFITVGSLVILVAAAAIVIPIVFKDDIKAAIDKQLASSINADVLYEMDQFHLSFFSNFPNITVEMGDLGVINREPFAGKVLFATEKFGVEINLFDILFGNQLRVKGITIDHPVINISVLKDGRANYDITFPSTDTTSAEDSGEFSFGIDHWEMIEANIVYDDQTLPYFLEIKGLNHNGSGDFTQDEFDLKTHTVADSVTTSFDGTEYLTHKRVDMDVVIAISEGFSKYTFKENAVKVNDFAMGFDGWFKMNENSYDMDIKFNSPDNSFKSLLSLVPGIYTESFNGIEARGELAFNGFVKGVMDDKKMPAFNVNLLVKDAMFKYPSLPTAIDNIAVDLLVDNKDGNLDHTTLDLKKLHLDFGKNPVDAKALITQMYPTQVDASLAAKLNLAELAQMFPVEGLDMKGLYAIDLKAKGTYDSLKKTIPGIDANMSLKNGYVKSSEFPIPLESMNFGASIKSPSGKMEETIISVPDFSMVLDKEKLQANLLIKNLDDYTWDVNVSGGLDLEKMTKVFPLEGMALAGNVVADIHTKGKYSDLEAGKYDRMPTSGTASLKNFKFSSSDLPYTTTISQAVMAFDPKKIDLKQCDGTIGKSDFRVKGALTNYLGYVFSDQSIQGNVDFNSNFLDLNEFMTETEETTADTASMGVIPVPTTLDFLMRASIKTVKMMDYTLTNASGDVVVKDGVADLRDMKFNMLGGGFAINGTYDTRDLAHPKYNMSLKIDNLSIKESAKSFSLVQAYAPIASLVNGNFSSDIKLSGELLKDMSPNLGSVSANGLFKIVEAALVDSKITSGITSLTKLDDINTVTLKDVLMSATINDGKLKVKPFDVKFGQYKTNVSGGTGMDGSLDYILKMDVPAGKLGTQFNSFVSQYTGGKNDPNANVPLSIGLGGKYDSPTPKLLMGDQKAQATQAATQVAKEEGTKVLQEAVKGKEAEKLVQNVLGGGAKKDSVKADSVATPKEAVQKTVEDEARKKIQNLLKKKN